MKRVLHGMNFFSCWICKEFCHFSSKCHKRVRKTKNNFLFDDDNFFKARMERFLNDSDDKNDELELVDEVMDEEESNPKIIIVNVETLFETNTNHLLL